MTVQTIAETISGVVPAVNGHGFQLAGRSGWLNLSKYAKTAPLLPREGMHVEDGLDRAGFVCAVHLLTPRQNVPPADMARASDLLCLVDDERGPAAEQRTGHSAPNPLLDRDMRILRQAVLNTATAILGSSGRAVNVADVLALAATLESRVSR